MGRALAGAKLRRITLSGSSTESARRFLVATGPGLGLMMYRTYPIPLQYLTTYHSTSPRGQVETVGGRP